MNSHRYHNHHRNGDDHHQDDMNEREESDHEKKIPKEDEVNLPRDERDGSRESKFPRLVGNEDDNDMENLIADQKQPQDDVINLVSDTSTNDLHLTLLAASEKLKEKKYQKKHSREDEEKHLSSLSPHPEEKKKINEEEDFHAILKDHSSRKSRPKEIFKLSSISSDKKRKKTHHNDKPKNKVESMSKLRPVEIESEKDEKEFKDGKEFKDNKEKVPVEEKVPLTVLQEKTLVLKTIQDYESKKVEFSKKWSLDDNINEMKFELEMKADSYNKKIQLKRYRVYLGYLAWTIEKAGTSSYLDFQLDGWSDDFKERLNSDDAEYDDILEELYQKYKQVGAGFPPELRLLFFMLLSAAGYHGMHKLIGPTLKKSLNDNPKLKAQIAENSNTPTPTTMPVRNKIPMPQSRVPAFNNVPLIQQRAILENQIWQLQQLQTNKSYTPQQIQAMKQQEIQFMAQLNQVMFQLQQQKQNTQPIITQSVTVSSSNDAKMREENKSIISPNQSLLNKIKESESRFGRGSDKKMEVEQINKKFEMEQKNKKDEEIKLKKFDDDKDDEPIIFNKVKLIKKTYKEHIDDEDRSKEEDDNKSKDASPKNEEVKNIQNEDTESELQPSRNSDNINRNKIQSAMDDEEEEEKPKKKLFNKRHDLVSMSSSQSGGKKNKNDDTISLKSKRGKNGLILQVDTKKKSTK